LEHLQKKEKNRKFIVEILQNIEFGAVQRVSNIVLSRSRKMLQNAPTLAIVAVDTAENEPSKVI
jgi:hypothetical protein